MIANVILNLCNSSTNKKLTLSYILDITLFVLTLMEKLEYEKLRESSNIVVYKI